MGKLALGYFLFYAPYSTLANLLSQGNLAGLRAPVPGLQILPVTAVM